MGARKIDIEHRGFRKTGQYKDMKPGLKVLPDPKPAPKSENDLRPLKELIKDKAVSQRDKLEALVTRCREANKLKDKDVMGLNMFKVNAEGINLNKLPNNVLQYGDWRGSNLKGQHFRKKSFDGGLFAGAQLHNASFEQCTFKDTDMEGAHTGLTGFVGCDMRELKGRGFKTDHDTNFTNTAMSGAEITEGDITRGYKVHAKHTRRGNVGMTPAQYDVLKLCEGADDKDRPQPKLKKKAPKPMAPERQAMLAHVYTLGPASLPAPTPY